MVTEPRIVSAEIGPLPRRTPAGLFDPMPRVTVTFDDGTKKELFEFYPDEIGFCPSEFVGLTEPQARDLRRRKDVAFLRS
jgi:hypothetical protein